MEAGSDRLLAPVSDVASGFVEEAVHTALISPLNSLEQLANAGSDLISEASDRRINPGHLAEIELFNGKGKASSAKATGRQIGAMAGTMLQILLLRRAVEELPGAGKGLAASASEQGALARSLKVSAATGAVQGGLLTPLAPGESNWNRLGHGAASTLTFLTMDGVSLMGRSGSAANTLRQSTLSGALGGVVQLQADSLLTGRGHASLDQTWKAALGGAAAGSIFHVAAKGAGFAWETSKTHLNSKNLAINEFGDSYLETTGRHGPDISAQRADDLDNQTLSYVENLIRTRNDGRPVRVLDLGGGTGGQSKRLARAGAEVTLVDLSDQQANIADFNRSLGKEQINFMQGSMSKLDVNSLSHTPFDVIYSQRAIQYLRYQEAHSLLSDLARANPKAKFFMSAVGLASDDGVGYADAVKPIEDRFAPLRSELAQKIKAYEPMALYTGKDFHQLLQSSGIENVNVWLSPSGNVKAIGAASEASAARSSILSDSEQTTHTTDTITDGAQSNMLSPQEFVGRFQEIQKRVVDTTERVAGSVRPGANESGIAEQLRSELAAAGLTDHWYPILINSGANSGLPLSRRFHLPSSEAVVRNNDIVIVDSTPSSGTVWGNWSKTVAVGDDPFFHELAGDADRLAQQTFDYAQSSARTIGDIYDFATGQMKKMNLVSLDPRDDVGHSIFQVPAGQKVEDTPLEHRLFISDAYRNSPLRGIISIEPQVGRINPKDGIMYGAKQQRVLITE